MYLFCFIYIFVKDDNRGEKLYFIFLLITITLIQIKLILK